MLWFLKIYLLGNIVILVSGLVFFGIAWSAPALSHEYFYYTGIGFYVFMPGVLLHFIWIICVGFYCKKGKVE